MNRLEAGQGRRYIVVGLINTVFGFAVFVALELSVGNVVPYIVVLLTSHVVSVLEAFLMQRRFVFRSRAPLLPELARFWSVYAVSLMVNAVLLPLVVEVGGAPVVPGQFAVLVVLALGTYTAHRLFTFSPAQPLASVAGVAALPGADPVERTP